MALWTIKAEYDAEARVWFTADSDVPGLITSGETLEQMCERAAAVLPDLFAANAEAGMPLGPGPHQLRVIAHHERTLAVAA